MSIQAGWYDPVTYQFFFSCIDSGQNSDHLIKVLLSILSDLKPYILQAASHENCLVGVTPNIIHPIIYKDDYDSFLIENLSKKNTIMNRFSLISRAFPSQYAIQTKDINKEWKKQVNKYMTSKRNSIPHEERKMWLAKLTSGMSSNLEGFCFPIRLFYPHSSMLYIGLNKILPVEWTREFASIPNSGH